MMMAGWPLDDEKVNCRSPCGDHLMVALQDVRLQRRRLSTRGDLAEATEESSA
jgi:hypothetical protein|tara:strand:- start:218 stop:376 length:159 start_codon:yes stop_codon:yes gene_type:complete